MKIFITNEQKAELEHLHHTCRDKRECDRIKTVLLAVKGGVQSRSLRLYVFMKRRLIVISAITLIIAN